MRHISLNKHESLAVPDADTCSFMAQYDTSGWVAIGGIGDKVILISKDEWTGFMKFVAELDDHMRYDKSGPYRKGIEHA